VPLTGPGYLQRLGDATQTCSPLPVVPQRQKILRESGNSGRGKMIVSMREQNSIRHVNTRFTREVKVTPRARR
jgi:hypothetical protein